VGSRLGKPNLRPAQWSLALDRLATGTPSCMRQDQWVLYLSGVAALAIADRNEGARIARSGRVNPCAECTTGFRADAQAGGVCRPEWFNEQEPKP
jgi:hypothetical protein